MYRNITTERQAAIVLWCNKGGLLLGVEGAAAFQLLGRTHQGRQGVDAHLGHDSGTVRFDGAFGRAELEGRLLAAGRQRETEWLTAARVAQNQTGLPVMNVFPRGQSA